MRRLQKLSVFFNIAVITLAVATLFVSCGEDNEGNDFVDLDGFLTKQDIGLFGYGGFLFKYTPHECQISVNVRRKQIRIQNDSQTAWTNIVFKKFPSDVKDQIELELRYMSGGDEIVQTTVMETVKVSGDKFWLWNRTNNSGIIIPQCW